jgi:hypothetical protein
VSSQSGRGGIGSHKHGIMGHTRPNPRNMQEVARWLNAASDSQAARKRRLASASMAVTVADLFRVPRTRRGANHG